MGWFIGPAVFVVIWWLVIFIVLPIGVRAAEEGDPGFGAGAPAQTYLGRKALVTTAIAVVIWLLVYWAVTHGLVNFRGE